MEQSQAQRRLVKSPPELWALVSTEESLGRHLAEFGEIRITRVDPETTVAWEGDRASGTVEISPTGWGTQVTLRATPVIPEVVAEPEAGVEPEPVAAGPTPAPAPVALEPEREPDPEPPDEPMSVQLTRVAAHPTLERGPVGTILLRRPEPPPRAESAPPPDDQPRGFFARFFRRPEPAAPRAEIPVPGPPPSDPSPPTPAPDPSPPAPPAPAPGPTPVPDPVPPDPGPDPTPPPVIERPEPNPVAAEAAPEAPANAAALDTERTAAILAEVLDDLGAAHHRPFSRD
jgi:hypothetical protein